MKNRKSGTIILWNDLDYLLKRRDSTIGNFYDQVERVKKHFTMIYHKRIFQDKLNIFFQGNDEINRIKSFDPFYENNKEAEIAYFGILEEYFGKKLGGYLLSEAIKNSFNQGAKRVWVHTCSLDHENALKNYLARGMKVFKTETLIR